MAYKKTLIIFFLIFLFSKSSVSAGSFDLSADTIYADDKNGYVYAFGNVHVQGEDISIHADEIYYDKNLSLIYIYGKFVAISEYVAFGEDLKYDVKKKEGYLKKGEIYYFSEDKTKQKFLWGENIILKGKETFYADKGGFSSCEGSEKSWRIEGAPVKVDAGKYLMTNNAALFAGDLPVFYSPVFVAPVKNEKESGFLIPGFGFSGKNGAILNLPYYLFLNESNDLTLTLKARTKNSIGTNAQYRYMLSRNQDGEMTTDLTDNYDKGREYGYFSWKHSSHEQDTLKIDLKYVNRDEYFKEYAETSEWKTTPYVRSTGYYELQWERELLSASLFFSKDISTTGDSFQRISLKNDGFLKPLFKDMHYNLNVSADSFIAEDGRFYERGTAMPMLTYRKYSENKGLFIDAKAQFNAYSQGPESESMTDKSFGVLNPGAFLDKSYIVNGNYILVNTFKIESILPQKFNQDKTYLSDARDPIDESKKIRYWYEEKWLNKNDHKTISYFALYQDYYLTERKYDEPLSDFFLVGRYYYDRLRFDSEASFDQQLGSFRDVVLGSAYETSFTKASASYRFLRDEEDFVSFDIWQKITYRWAAVAGLRYDIMNSIARETKVGTEYLKNCYNIKLNFIRRDIPREDLFLISVDLYGLGEIKQNF